MGHSWGGYETTFLLTQTDMFAAGVAGGPLTNLASSYGEIYWNSGGPETNHAEVGQERMEVPLYEDPQAYIRNSAVYFANKLSAPLLLSVGDHDGASDWHQDIELYNSARRAGKPVVMLVYEGENHAVAQKANQLDYHRRINAWFDHYLKGEPAPEWITQGVTVLERERELKRGKERRLRKMWARGIDTGRERCPNCPTSKLYVEALRTRVGGHILRGAAIAGRSCCAPWSRQLAQLLRACGHEVRRAGKRIALGFDHGLWLAIHLMIAGRLHWNGRRAALAAFEFDSGTLTLTEAGTQHRAQIHVLESPPEAAGLEPLDATAEEFAAALKSENHTLKRALTDPRLFSGIGNAYSDEILHRARLSPIAMTLKLPEAETGGCTAVREVLTRMAGATARRGERKVSRRR